MVCLTTLALPDAGFRAIAQPFLARLVERGGLSSLGIRVRTDLELGVSIENARSLGTEAPFAVLIEADVEDRTNGLTKKFAKLKIKNAMVVADEDCFSARSRSDSASSRAGRFVNSPSPSPLYSYRRNCELHTSNCRSLARGQLAIFRRSAVA